MTDLQDALDQIRGRVDFTRHVIPEGLLRVSEEDREVLLAAVEAVLEMHYAASKWFPATNERVMRCRQCDVAFPCPTVKAIQEAME